MVYPKLEDKLDHARHALERASIENISDRCQQYLALLAEYRCQIFELKGTPDVRQPPASSSSPKQLATRKAIRAAIEDTTRERNRTEMLLLSITTVSGYEAVEIFNARKFAGHTDWELRPSGVKPTGSSAHDLMTIQEAVDIAGMLRREEYVAQNAPQTRPEADADQSSSKEPEGGASKVKGGTRYSLPRFGADLSRRWRIAPEKQTA